MTRISVRELPPLRLSHKVTAPNGHPYRWGPDEHLAENVPSDLTMSSHMPGGFEHYSTTLPRKTGVDYADLQQLSTITVQGAGGEIAGEYRLEAAPRSSGDSFSISPDAVGWQAALEDREDAWVVYMDRALDSWSEPSAERRADLKTAAWKETIEASTVGADASGKGPGLFFTITDLEAGFTNLGELWYYADGADLGHVIAVMDADPGANASWTDQLALSPLDVHDVGPVDTSNDADRSPGVTMQVTASQGGQKYAVAQVYFPSAAIAGLNEWQLFAYPRVIGRHGLTIRGSAPAADGFYASDIVAYAVRMFAPALRYTTGPEGTIQPSDFVIPHLRLTGGKVTAADHIQQANRVHLRDWAVWEGRRPNDPTFYYHSRGARGRRWRTRIEPVQLREAGPQIARQWNSVVVEYTDVDGTTRTVGPPGSPVRNTSTLLVDSDPENPLNLRGLTKRIVLSMNGVGTPATAIEVGRRFLEQSKLLNTSGQAQFVGYAIDDRGRVRPAWQVRAGDEVSFTNAADTNYRRIIRAEYSESTRTTNVDIDAPPDGLEQLLERLQVAIVAIG